MDSETTTMPAIAPSNGTTQSGNKQTNISLIVTGCIVAVVFLCIGLMCLGAIRRSSRKNRDEETPTDPARTQRLDKVAASQSFREWKQGAEDSTRLAQQSSNPLVCTICLEVLGDDDMVRHLPCNHVFHSECLNKWYLKQHYTCPLCKGRYIKRGAGLKALM